MAVTKIKVPKEVMELVYEKRACLALAEHFNSRWLGSLKVIYYKAKAERAEALIARAMHGAFPEVREGDWYIDSIEGTALRLPAHETTPAAPKKPRAPRKPKAEPAQQGDVK